MVNEEGGHIPFYGTRRKIKRKAICREKESYEMPEELA